MSLLVVCLFLSDQCSGQCPVHNDVVPRSFGPSHIQTRTLSPNGQWISIKTGDGVVWLLQVENRARIAAKVALIPCVESSVQALAFSPDSSLLAVGDGNGIIRIFDTAAGRQVREFHEDSWVLELHFDSRNILISNGNYGLSIWNVAQSRRITLIPGARCDSAGNCTYEIYDHYALSPDQNFLALSGRYISGIIVRDLAGKVTSLIPALDESPSFAFRPGRPSNLFVADGQGHISSWDAATGKLLKEFPATLHPYIRLAFVPGSDANLLTFDSASANVWNCDTEKVLHGWKPVEDGHFLSSDGAWITNSAVARIEVPHIPESHLLMNIRYKSYGQIVVHGN
jgi:WD40 repeat protein